MRIDISHADFAKAKVDMHTIRYSGRVMESALLDQGIELMLVGMGTVFVFLSVLVVAMSVMSALSTRFVSVAIDSNAGEEEVAAITAAVAQHRNTTKK